MTGERKLIRSASDVLSGLFSMVPWIIHEQTLGNVRPRYATSLNFPESDILFCIKCTVNVHLNYSKTDEALEYLVV